MSRRRSLPFSPEPVADEAPAEAGSQPAAQQQVLITVSTETFGARAILPCFDLPAYKANFSFTLSHPVGAVALANTAASSTGPSPLGEGLQETQVGCTGFSPSENLQETRGHLCSLIHAR